MWPFTTAGTTGASSPQSAARFRRRQAAFAIGRDVHPDLLGVGIRAYRDLSREAWSYWKELYFSPSLTSSLIANVDVDGPGNGRPALAISEKIGSASASWFRDRLGEAHLAAGDLVLLSSPGGDVDQALMMGEIIRSRGLMTAVGIADSAGRVNPPIAPTPACWSLPAAARVLASKVRCSVCIDL